MRHLVAKDVDDDRPRQTDECDQPKDNAEREEPKFRARPQALMNCCSGKSGKECLGQDRARWQKKNCDDVFDPARRHGQRHRLERNAPRRRREVAYDPYARRLFTASLRNGPAMRHEIYSVMSATMPVRIGPKHV